MDGAAFQFYQKFVSDPKIEAATALWLWNNFFPGRDHVSKEEEGLAVRVTNLLLKAEVLLQLEEAVTPSIGEARVQQIAAGRGKTDKRCHMIGPFQSCDLTADLASTDNGRDSNLPDKMEYSGDLREEQDCIVRITLSERGIVVVETANERIEMMLVTSTGEVWWHAVLDEVGDQQKRRTLTELVNHITRKRKWRRLTITQPTAATLPQIQMPRSQTEPSICTQARELDEMKIPRSHTDSALSNLTVVEWQDSHLSGDRKMSAHRAIEKSTQRPWTYSELYKEHKACTEGVCGILNEMKMTTLLDGISKSARCSVLITHLARIVNILLNRDDVDYSYLFPNLGNLSFSSSSSSSPTMAVSHGGLEQSKLHVADDTPVDSQYNQYKRKCPFNQHPPTN